jgi:hypothetical protein
MLPEGAKVLKVGVQDGGPAIWVLQDNALPQKLQSFHTYMTGENITVESGEYLGTFQLPGGNFEYVGHVFKEGDL